MCCTHPFGLVFWCDISSSAKRVTLETSVSSRCVFCETRCILFCFGLQTGETSDGRYHVTELTREEIEGVLHPGGGDPSALEPEDLEPEDREHQTDAAQPGLEEIWPSDDKDGNPPLSREWNPFLSPQYSGLHPVPLSLGRVAGRYLLMGRLPVTVQNTGLF